MSKWFVLGLFLIAVSTLKPAVASTEVLYVAGPQGSSAVSLYTYNVNPNTAIATQVGRAVKVPTGSILPLSIGANHYVYLWNSSGVWLYPTNASGVPFGTARQHLTFSFAHPVSSFLVNPDGKFASAAMTWVDSQENDRASIVLFTIDQATGRLTNTNQVVASYSHQYIGFINFLFGLQGGKLFAEYLDNGPFTTIFGYDFYPVDQRTGRLGSLQSLEWAQAGDCTTSCAVAITSLTSAASSVCCGAGSGDILIARNASGEHFNCQASNATFCGDDVASLTIDPASTNLFFGDATVNQTYIGNIDFNTSQLAVSPSTIPGTPPLYFSPDSRLVYAANSNSIGIYALETSSGTLTANSTLADQGPVTVATTTLRN